MIAYSLSEEEYDEEEEQMYESEDILSPTEHDFTQYGRDAQEIQTETQFSLQKDTVVESLKEKGIFLLVCKFWGNKKRATEIAHQERLNPTRVRMEKALSAKVL